MEEALDRPLSAPRDGKDVSSVAQFPSSKMFSNAEPVKTETIVFGDSFAGIFKLLDAKACVKVVVLKGSTAKGLTKPDHQNRSKIGQIVNQYRPTCCLFSFGQVDVHLSFYYDLLVKGIDHLPNLREIASQYVEFIASIEHPCTKIVLAVYPCAVKTENVKYMLHPYTGVAQDVVDACPEEIWTSATQAEMRIARLIEFNSGLEESCKLHGIEYRSINDQILDSSHTVKPQFIDPSPLSMHLLWEPLMGIWTNRINAHGIERRFLVDTAFTKASYLAWKSKKMVSDKWHGAATLKKMEEDEEQEAQQQVGEGQEPSPRRERSRSRSRDREQEQDKSGEGDEDEDDDEGGAMEDDSPRWSFKRALQAQAVPSLRIRVSVQAQPQHGARDRGRDKGRGRDRQRGDKKKSAADALEDKLTKPLSSRR